MAWLAAIAGFLVVCAGAGAFLAFRSPGFYAGLAMIVARAFLPQLARALAPRDLTEEERERIRQGQDIATKAHGHGGESH
ncbi:MAG: hypothetical protein HY245_13220 [Rhizobiales bacterium]|nr:hypothetical protein [Hyphomicrobiales bacterium]MBI3674351.1 hypothetical protein [Hyphomicrobiales bacterium]